MFKSLKGFFADSNRASGTQDEVVQLQVATCALLLEVAHADDNYSDDELETITSLVAQRFDLDGTGATDLLNIAAEARSASGDVYHFSRLVNDSFSRERKLAVVELLWEVVYSDGILEAHEDALMHKLGTLLGVRHDELMALKSKVKRDNGP